MALACHICKTSASPGWFAFTKTHSMTCFHGWLVPETFLRLGCYVCHRDDWRRDRISVWGRKCKFDKSRTPRSWGKFYDVTVVFIKDRLILPVLRCYRSDYKTLIELSVWRKKALLFPGIPCSSLSFHQCVHLPVFLSIQLSVWLSTHPPRQLVNFLSIDCVSHNVLGMGYGNELSRVSAPLECGPRGGR